MPNPSRYFLTGLMLEFWKASDHAKKVRKAYEDPDMYRMASLNVIKAAKKVNHEALTRYLDGQHTIPYPWEGDGGLEQ